jgi:hypothetical protein
MVFSINISLKFTRYIEAFIDIMNEKATNKENVICYPVQCNYICDDFIYVFNEHWG